MALYRDESEDGEGLDEGPEERDLAAGASVDLAQCPFCGKAVREEAPRCHHCGRHISPSDLRPRLPWWVWIGLLACMLMALIWALFPHVM